MKYSRAFFQFHVSKLHGAPIASRRCNFCGERGGVKIYCKACKDFISHGSFQGDHQKGQCPNGGIIPDEDTFRKEFVAVLGHLGVLVGKIVEEGFVLKGDGGEIYVGSWPLNGTLKITKEEALREKGELEGWVERAKKG